IALPQGVEHPQSGPHSPLGGIFMRERVAEVDEQAIAERLRDMPLKAGGHLGTGVLIDPHHLAQVFWVELTREGRRVHEVTEQHGELLAFAFEGTPGGEDLLREIRGGVRERGWRWRCEGRG